MARLDYPLWWNVGVRELVLNNHRTEDGGVDDAAIMAGYYLVEAYDFSPLDIREQREGMHLQTGGDLGPANRTFRHISLRGNIIAPSGARLDDMEAALLSAFDIEHAQIDNPDQFGEGTLKHLSETSVSVPGVGGRVLEGFYCRPERYPITFDRRGQRGHTRAFLAQLVSPYPYRVLFPEQEVVFSAANGWSQTLPNWTTREGGISRLSLDVSHTGNGASNFTISDGTRSLVLDMSSAGVSNLYIDMWSGQIYNTADEPKQNLRTSDVDSFFDIPPGGATVTISNVTNIASVTATYHQTRA
jgi:hypothetical protein